MEIHGTFFDGRSARGREAVLTMSGKVLLIAVTGDHDDGGQAEFEWPVKQVELAELPLPGAPVRLRCRAAPEAVFVVTDGTGIESLTEHLPHLLDTSRRHRKRLTFVVAAFAVSVLIVLGVYFGWPQIARSIAYMIPPEWEERLGDAAMSQMEAMIGETCAAGKDRPGLDALDRLAGRLAQDNELLQSVEVHVLDWPLKNAFALPGGHVVFTSGIIEFMEGPDELAGVLAHEMGHVDRRHVMISLIEGWGLNLFLSVVFGGAGGASDASYLVLSSAYSRELEREADEVGMELLARAGIDSAGFARLFKRFQQDREAKDSGDKFLLPDFIRTHPATESRIARAQSRQAAGANVPALKSREWAAVRAVCDG